MAHYTMAVLEYKRFANPTLAIEALVPKQAIQS
jgi:hypothetical protein